MNTLVFNLNHIKSPITGIGRYVIELVRGNLAQGKALVVVHGGKLYQGGSINALLESLELPASAIGNSASVSLKGALKQVPFSHDLHRSYSSRQFLRLVSSQLDASAIYHDVNYAHYPRHKNHALKQVSTIYDLSHLSFGHTHPKHRVAFLKRYFDRLAEMDSPIITISNAIKQELCTSYQISEQRVHVTHLAAGDEFKPRTEDQCTSTLRKYDLNHKGYVLCVGAIEPRKNLLRVLHAYQKLPTHFQEAFPLVITGPTAWKSKRILSLIESLRSKNLVKQTGFVIQKELVDLYAGASVFVYPSLYEGFGLPVIEAMKSGCATITSNRGALAEVAGEAAIKISPDNTDQLCDALQRLLSDSSLEEHYSKLGLERASSFSWRNTVEKTQDVYNAIQ